MIIRTLRRAAKSVPEITRTLVSDPPEGWGMLQEKIAAVSDRRQPPCPYNVCYDWEHQLHRMLGVDEPDCAPGRQSREPNSGSNRSGDHGGQVDAGDGELRSESASPSCGRSTACCRAALR
jgi:hypothetical protein